MKKQTKYDILAIVVIIIIVAASFYIFTNEKQKFIGTWRYSTNGTITFYDDNSATINNIGLLGLTQFIGTITYEIKNNQVIFTSGSISLNLNYNFQDSNTLILSDSSGNSITLTKI